MDCKVGSGFPGSQGFSRSRNPGIREPGTHFTIQFYIFLRYNGIFPEHFTSFLYKVSAGSPFLGTREPVLTLCKRP
jgi:hypothetical protein